MNAFILLLTCFSIFLSSSAVSFADTATESPPLGRLDIEFVTCADQPWAAHGIADLDNGLVSCSAVIARQDGDNRKLLIALTNRAWIEFDLGHFQGNNLKALADFNAALTLAPTFRVALAGRAELFLNSGENEKAVDDYTQLINLYPPNAATLVGRGDSYNNLHEYDLGIADFNRAIALDPKDAEAMNDRAWALVRKGDYKDAIVGYDSALLVATDLKGIVLANRAEAKAMLGETESALADCNAALAINPHDSNALEERGFVNFKVKRYLAALDDYNASLAIDSSGSSALFGRGATRIKLGQVALGRADIAAAEKSFPGIQTYMAQLGVSS